MSNKTDTTQRHPAIWKVNKQAKCECRERLMLMVHWSDSMIRWGRSRKWSDDCIGVAMKWTYDDVAPLTTLSDDASGYLLCITRAFGFDKRPNSACRRFTLSSLWDITTHQRLDSVPPLMLLLHLSHRLFLLLGLIMMTCCQKSRHSCCIRELFFIQAENFD